ncbi:hypothetical protein ACBJ59_23065 [Nonomuraea sp. MTCD27]|uniref:hypothetical protein n=1 Tax=Nonomuraea sp. MTCD27 TaxID=1676747 RepID=UPI0035C07B2F
MRTTTQRHHDTPHGPALRVPSWNALLAIASGLAARTGRARQGREVSWMLSARPSAVPSARRMTAARLTAWGLREHAATVQLLVGELVCDTLGRGATTIRLALGLEEGLLRVEVEGGGLQPGPDPYQPVLARLACCWGVAGQVAWFELPTSGPCAPH